MAEKHKLVVIGCLGIRRAYLDVPLEEAIKRFLESEKQTELHKYDHVEEYEITDEFCCYDAWGE